MVTISRITPDNALQFRRVRLQALQESPTAFGSTYASEVQRSDTSWIEWADTFNGKNSIGYLAFDCDVLCGTARGWFHGRDYSTASLLSMWVAPSHRRHGVGRQLVETVACWAKDQGAHALKLNVTNSNHAAIAFYERLGFAKTGITKAYPNDAALCELEMATRLA